MMWAFLHNRSICRADSCGNTFVLIDGREAPLALRPEEIKALCAKSQGLDADGLIIFEQVCAYHTYKMQYFNCDGYPADLCGNGLLSLARWIYELSQQASHNENGPCLKSFVIESTKASHHIHIEKGLEEDTVRVTCEMPEIEDVEEIMLEGHSLFIAKCGVPHLVMQGSSCESLQDELQKYAALYRHHPHFKKRGGVNVNVVCFERGILYAHTFERGVEGETKSCGTGATVIAYYAHKTLGIPYPIEVHMPGGVLSVNNRSTTGASILSRCLELTTPPKLFSVSPHIRAILS